MSPTEITNFLGWCALGNYLILLLWAACIILLPDWLYRLHTRWFDIPRQQFFAIHYSMMGYYKLGIFLLNLIPFIVLRAMGY